MTPCLSFDIAYTLTVTTTGRMPYVHALTEAAALAAVRRRFPEATNLRVLGSRRTTAARALVAGLDDSDLTSPNPSKET